jgi:hypothetical protein
VIRPTVGRMRTRSLTDEIKIRVEPELRLAIEAEAAADRRPVSSLIRNVLADYAARRSRRRALRASRSTTSAAAP